MTRMQSFHTFINIYKKKERIDYFACLSLHFMYKRYCQLKRLPVHTLPFPLYPFKHAHEKLPNVLVQLALT